MTRNVDLHSHSLLSDGVLSPEDVAARASAHGVQVWALTDHDEVRGLEPAARAAARLGLHFVPGVEISVSWGGHTVHVLGLNIDPECPPLVNGLAGIRRAREQRARALADHLAAHGIHAAYEGALRQAGNPELLGRLHFARFLVEEGHCRSVQQAFDRYLGEGAKAFAAMQWSGLEAAVGWILAAGGKAVIAHPGRNRHSAAQQDALFETFKDLGGHGLEIVCGGHTPTQQKAYARMAQRFGFEASRGSDFHAPGTGRFELGHMPELPAGLTPVWHDWC